MFGKKSKARKIAGLLILGALAVPGVSQAAAPSITSLVAFGNVRPGDPPPAVDPALAPNMGSDTIFANSRPFGFRYEHGLIYIEGVVGGPVDPDGRLRAQVDVTVSDPDGLSITRTLAVRSVAEPEFGSPQGDQGYFEGSFAPTQLGRHTATGTDPQSTNPADWGGTLLTVRAIARNPAGETSLPAETTITKYAATPKDSFAPSLSRIKWPPIEWCHLSSKGAHFPFSEDDHLGGTSEGSCGDFSPFVPLDPTWTLCWEPLKPFVSLRDLTTDPFFTGEHLWGNSEYCREARSEDEYMPSGQAIVAGLADDTTGSGAYGIGSEIADIKIDVTQGGVILRTIRDFDRPDGPQGQWNFSMSINDFAPTSFGLVDFADPYVLKVTACDAWGQCSTAQSDDIRVYPY